MPPAEEPSEAAKPADKFVWDVDMEVQLFFAMAGHKPVGVNKHFNMIAIWEKLSNSITKEVSTDNIWQHLDTLYDLQLLDDTEPIPFPNDDVEFSLPDEEFHSLIKQKCKDAILSEDFESDVNLLVGSVTPDQLKESPSPKMILKTTTRSSTTKDNTAKAPAIKKEPPPVKNRKESCSSTETHLTNKSDKDSSSRRRDSRDSNASSTKDGSSSRKSSIRGSSTWDTLEDLERGRASRRRPQQSTPPTTAPPAKRRRT